MDPVLPTQQSLLLNEFRMRYPKLERDVCTAIQASYGDSVVLERLGDDLDEFRIKVDQVRAACYLLSRH